MIRNENITIEIRTMLDNYGQRVYFGVLETPCFPASFYAYFVTPDGRDGYLTTDHATCDYHRDKVAAKQEFDRLYAHYSKQFKAQREKNNEV